MLIDVTTYRIVTDGTFVFRLPYSCWLVAPYEHLWWVVYDASVHAQLPVVWPLISQRGNCGAEAVRNETQERKAYGADM